MEILILGRGVSAISLYKVLKENNHVTYAIENNEKLDDISIYKDNVNIDNYDMFYISPGVKKDDKLFLKIKENNRRYSSEIEYALEKLKNHKIIAVTGSNGKTTIVSLLNFILKKKNIKSVVCGNIGDPLVNYIHTPIDTIIILEISSFQLEQISHIKPFIAIISNITDNHLDRHTLDEYIELKKKITLYQDNKNYLLVNKLTNKKYNITSNAKKIIIKNKHIKTPYLLGKHNQDNISFVFYALKILKVNHFRKYIKEFKGVKYRMEYIGRYKNTKIYNDAKSTTPASTLAAINCFDFNTLLILGGRNKNLDYSNIENLKIKKIIMYGEEALKNKNPSILKFKDLSEVFIYLKDNILNYKVILHSPCFTSFDLYENYMKRGEEFEKKCKEYFEIK